MHQNRGPWGILFVCPKPRGVADEWTLVYVSPRVLLRLLGLSYVYRWLHSWPNEGRPVRTYPHPSRHTQHRHTRNTRTIYTPTTHTIHIRIPDTHHTRTQTHTGHPYHIHTTHVHTYIPHTHSYQIHTKHTNKRCITRYPVGHCTWCFIRYSFDKTRGKSKRGK